MLKKDCTMEEVSERLEAPFSSKDIEWRVSRSGNSNGKNWAMVLAYVTNRAIQNRLDEVFGPGGWKNEYKEFMGGILCTISCYVDGEWVSKSDGAELTAIESLKGGLSSSMKRCGSQWKIGRYLYNLSETYVEVLSNKVPGSIYMQDKKNNIKGYWVPPKLPNWALPENERGQHNSQSITNGNQSNQQQRRGQNNNQGNNHQNNQNQQRGNQNNQQQNQNQTNQTGFNRGGATKAINQYLQEIGVNPQWVMGLFRMINPKITLNSVQDVYQKATEEELKKYYLALRPVHDLKMVAEKFKVSLESVLIYARILVPDHNIENLLNCINKVSAEHVTSIVEMVKSDLKNGDLQQIA